MSTLTRTLTASAAVALLGLGLSAMATETQAPASQETRTFMDVHVLGPGNVTADAVAEAHQKDLEVQHRHGVSFESYWVDEDAGLVFCLATAPDAQAVADAHREAHGLVPDQVHEVVEGR